MNGQPISACDYARDRHRNLMRWRNLWTILLIVFGATTIVILSVSAVFFLNESWLPAGVTLLGTMAQGAAVTWVVNRRSESVKEEEAAYEDVKKVCFPTGGAEMEDYHAHRNRALRLW